MPVRLRLLGSPRFEVEDVSEELPLGKPASLLYYLAVRGEWVSRTELSALYRPDMAEAGALNYLRGLIFRARPFAWATDAEFLAERVRWRVPHDVGLFSASVAESRWSDALELYGGRFLAGLQAHDSSPLGSWLELQRSDLEALWAEAVLNQARALEHGGDPIAATRLWEQLLTHDPYHEQAVQALMRTLYAQGRRDRALTAYERFRSGLENDLAIAPLEATRVLADRIRAIQGPPGEGPIRVGGDLPAGAKGSVAAPSLPFDLPPERTRFVGREHEVRQLRAKLADPDCRLVVITGLGGVGKTRLALRVAGAAGADYPHGVVFAALAHLVDADALPRALADALGLLIHPEADPWEQLVAHLRDRRQLVVLDNVEQLAGGGAELLTRLLEAAPGLDLLVTSRAPVVLQRASHFELEGLRYPPPGAEEPARTFDAVELFLDAAERARHGFRPSDADMGTIAELCRRVEGLPLALELAAAWTRLLPVTDILAGLADGLDLLASEHVDLPERHRSLRAILEASWRQLGRDEQRTLAALALFRGSPTQEAVAEISDARPATLLALANRSLLSARDGGRFDLHPLVARFAAEKLDGLESAPELEERYAAHYLGLLTGAASGGRADGALMAEWGNLLAAWTWAISARRFDLLEAACEPLRLLCEASGRFRDGIALFDAVAGALDVASEQGRRVVGQALIGAAWLRGWLNDDARASEQAQHGVELLEPLAMPEAVLLGLRTLGHAAYRGGRFRDAQAPLQRALELARRQANQPASMGILATLGLVELWLDRLPEAEAALLEAHALGRRFERVDIVIESLMALAVLDQTRANPASSRDRLEEALTLAGRAGLHGHRAHLLYNLGQALLDLGALDDARARCREALELATASDDPMALTFSRAFLGRIALAGGDLAVAERELIAAVATAWQRQLLAALPILLIYVAKLRLEQGRPEDGADLIGTVFSHAPMVPRVGALGRPLCRVLECELPKDAFRTAFDRGRQRPLEGVVGALL